MQNDRRRPAGEADVVDANIDQQRVSRALEDIGRPAARDGAAQGGSGRGVKSRRLLLLRRRRFGLSAPGVAGGAIGAERVGLADLLIGQSDFRAAADHAFVGRGAPFDAVIAVKDAFRDRRARAAIGQDGEGLVGILKRGAKRASDLPRIDGAMAPAVGPLARVSLAVSETGSGSRAGRLPPAQGAPENRASRSGLPSPEVKELPKPITRRSCGETVTLV